MEAAHVRARRRQRRRRPRQGAGAPSDRTHRRTGGRVMLRDASQPAHRLAWEAEAVCRHYLSNGRREGRYWLVGDVRNTPGRSMFVRLKRPESGRGAAGKWTDAATGEHGDLLDVIRESCGLLDFTDVAEEARRFLSLPRSVPEPSPKAARPAAQTGSPERPSGSSPCRGRSLGLSQKRICAIAALRLCAKPAACASIRAATIAWMTPRRPRPGRP